MCLYYKSFENSLEVFYLRFLKKTMLAYRTLLFLAHFFQELISILDKNTELREPILEMLMYQLKGYYEKNEEVNPPLKLEPCIMSQGDQVFLVEPLVGVNPFPIVSIIIKQNFQNNCKNPNVVNLKVCIWEKQNLCIRQFTRIRFCDSSRSDKKIP